MIQIASNLENKCSANDSVYSVGWNRNGVEFRTLLHFTMGDLPKDCVLMRASLILNICSGSRMLLRGCQIVSEWNPNQVSWYSQPCIECDNYSFSHIVKGYSQYQFDLTQLVELWIKNPECNYGIMLLGCDQNPNAYMNLNGCGIKLVIEYVMNEHKEIQSEYSQYTEYLKVNSKGTFTTQPRDVSRTMRCSYFVQNSTNTTVLISLEASPDLVHFYEEIQLISVASGQTQLIEPINYSRYIRLKIQADEDNSVGEIFLWMDRMEWNCEQSD